MLEQSIRRFLHKFRTTPFHPQWFTFRDESRILKLIGKRATGLLLDVGCGTRRLEQFITPECTYFGIDYEPVSRLYGSRPDLYADAQKLPFIDESADTVSMLEVMEHIPDPASAFKEVTRVLKQNGELLLSVPYLYPIHDAPHDYQRWTEYGIRKLGNTNGLLLQHIESRGTPIETAVLTLNIALSRLTLRLLQKLNPISILLLIFTPPLIVTCNLMAALLRFTDQSDNMMPFGYVAIFRKEKL